MRFTKVYLGVVLLSVCLTLPLARTIGAVEAGAAGGPISETTAAFDAEAFRSLLLEKLPTLPISQIESSPIKGLYEVSLTTGEVILVDPTGEYYVFGGQVLQVNGPGDMVNLTEQKASRARVEQLEGADESKMVIYEPEGRSRGDLYVFTDVDCGYCQKFHQEVPALNKMGITVKYLAWPRAGIDSGTGRKMTQIWCADDQRTAMDQAKARQTITSEKLCKAPIPIHFDLGMKLGVKGTPAIYLSDGRQVGGYRSAKALAQEMGI